MTAIDTAGIPHRSVHPGGEPIQSPEITLILHAQSGEALTVPKGFLLLKADFEREGTDLVLIAGDGSRLIIKDYFAVAEPPALMTVGGAVLPPDLVELLAGPRAAGQYAQLATDATAIPIGKVVTVEGLVTVARVDGTAVPLFVDMPVFQGDVLETEAGATVGLVFTDDTTFALGENGRLVLDKLIYDPDTGVGSSAFSVIEGVFVFVSGQIAANNPDQMLVRTPVATIGIRGTKTAGKAAAEGEENTFVLLPDPDGTVGEIVVMTQAGQLHLTEAYTPVTVSSAFAVPETAEIGQVEFDRLFDAVLNFLPAPPDRTGIEEIEPAAGEEQIVSGGVIRVVGDSFGAEREVDAALLSFTFAFFGIDVSVGGADGDSDTDHDESGDSLTPTGILLIGTEGDDVLQGTNLNDTIIGLGGNDILAGRGGSDILDGGDGEDTVRGGGGNDFIIGRSGQGNDFLNGEGGFDTASYLSANAPVIVNLTNGTAEGDASIGFDTLVDIENIAGGFGDDTLIGDENANRVFGSFGDNLIEGRGGNDTLLGGEDLDTLLGGEDNDTLVGELGNDSLDGGTGDDSLNGGGGKDSLSGGDGEDFVDGGGDDILNGDDDFDILIGGSGDDILIQHTERWCRDSRSGTLRRSALGYDHRFESRARVRRGLY